MGSECGIDVHVLFGNMDTKSSRSDDLKVL